MESIKAKINALPCLPNEDDGIYFRNGGGFLKVGSFFSSNSLFIHFLMIALFDP